MLFIVSSNNEQVDPATRKLIRSHVKQGKKQKKVQKKDDRTSTVCLNKTCRHQMVPIKPHEVIRSYTQEIPGRTGSDFSFIEFADETEPWLAFHLTQFSTIAMRTVFPLMMAVGYDTDDKEALYPMTTDPALLHVTAYALEGFFDKILRHQEYINKPAIMLHFQKAVGLLRERLSGQEEDSKISDSTINAVLKLAEIAHFEGNCQASNQHMDAICKMVDMRGGLEVFRETKVQGMMLRCDLTVALRNNFKPLFFNQPSQPVVEYPEKLVPTYEETRFFEQQLGLGHTVDKELAMAWLVMKKFCLQVNLGIQLQRLINPQIILDTMTSVMYRLFGMSFIDDSFEQTLWLGLLAFCHHIFLQWHDIKLPYHRFSTAYKSCLVNLHLDETPSQLVLWLAMVGATSLFTMSDDAWLHEYLQNAVKRSQVSTWKELQSEMRSVMWIELLDDKRGKHIYDSL